NEILFVPLVGRAGAAALGSNGVDARRALRERGGERVDAGVVLAEQQKRLTDLVLGAVRLLLQAVGLALDAVHLGRQPLAALREVFRLVRDPLHLLLHGAAPLVEAAHERRQRLVRGGRAVAAAVRRARGLGE